LLENAISPIQQYSYTSGKNSSDSALITACDKFIYIEILKKEQQHARESIEKLSKRSKPKAEQRTSVSKVDKE
jgi:predicted mannosyl-3-phosphoglycerate phosphatase (HAD superfamily)